MVVCNFNFSTWEAEVGGSLKVRGQLGLHRELQNSQSYSETLTPNTAAQANPMKIPRLKWH